MSLVITNDDMRAMSDEELRRVNHCAATEIRRRHDLKIRNTTNTFRVGDKVEFKAGDDTLRTCEVKKINTKTVEVHELANSRQPFKRWKVTSTLCTKVG